MAKNKVNPMEPKYAAEKGSRGPDARCLVYVSGPIKTAHEARNRSEPKDHLCRSSLCQPSTSYLDEHLSAPK